MSKTIKDRKEVKEFNKNKRNSRKSKIDIYDRNKLKNAYRKSV